MRNVAKQEISNTAVTTTPQIVNVQCGAGMRTLRFLVTMPETSAPEGTLVLTGSAEGTRYYPVNLDSARVGGLVAAEITLSTNTITIDTPSAAVALNIGVEFPMPYMRLVWTCTGGGHTSGLYVESLLTGGT